MVCCHSCHLVSVNQSGGVPELCHITGHIVWVRLQNDTLNFLPFLTLNFKSSWWNSGHWLDTLTFWFVVTVKLVNQDTCKIISTLIDQGTYEWSQGVQVILYPLNWDSCFIHCPSAIHQVMPQLLYYLRLDSIEGVSIDWGTLSVYTCGNSCASTPTDVAYQQEFLWKQDPSVY